ncbi:MAG: response regulator [Alphaproteobacteria bacterium]|nr:response regulator [Alphaproteobacteria bacterium]
MAIRPSAISVLVIEDSSFHRKMAVETLRGVGIGQIEALASAAEALKAASGLKPDLILSDWIMPEMDGMALVRLIRRGETHQKAPVRGWRELCGAVPPPSRRRRIRRPAAAPHG